MKDNLFSIRRAYGITAIANEDVINKIAEINKIGETIIAKSSPHEQVYSRLGLETATNIISALCSDEVTALEDRRREIREYFTQITGIDFEYLYQRSKDCGDD